MPKFSASSAGARGKKFASKIASSKIGSSIGAYAEAKPRRAAAIGYAGAATMGGIMKKRGPGVSKKFANGRRSTSIYKY